jgi:cyclopropane-fatty-acyl-phospholipid synthase
MIHITPENVDGASRDLPLLVRKAFRYASRLRIGSLQLVLPDGRAFLFTGESPGPNATMVIRDLSFARRLITGGDIGFAEAYLRGEWESPDVTCFLELFCRNHEVIQSLLPGQTLLKWWNALRHFANRNTKQQARRNIHAHYDLGNRFYSAWLDRSMTYSSAIFAPGDNDLSSGQRRKNAELARATDIRPEHHVLEIGCGWGGFAEYAAREIGCRVTGLTISQEQHDYAQQRIQAAGLGERVTIKLLDYRDERGTYDRIASIEMFEAVGEAYWPTYFGQLRDRLNPGGLAGLQIITIQDRFFETYRREIDFIRRYVFPGGMLPSPGRLGELAQSHGFLPRGEKIFGLDYARTLAAWRDQFRSAWPHLQPLGFDERFRRLWEYYLSYCEAGFRAGSIDVRQLVYAKAG